MDELSEAEAKARAAEQAAVRAEQAPQARSSSSIFKTPPPRPPQEQWEFNRAMVAALLETVRSCQNALAEQGRQVARAQQESAAVLAMAERIHELQRRAQDFEGQIEEKLSRAAEAAERSAAERREEHASFNAQVRQELETFRGEMRAAFEALRNETRDRIESLLNEQRVCVRQISLQTSEEAVLADRARRATELRLDELARQLEKLVQAAAA